MARIRAVCAARPSSVATLITLLTPTCLLHRSKPIMASAVAMPPLHPPPHLIGYSGLYMLSSATGTLAEHRSMYRCVSRLLCLSQSRLALCDRVNKSHQLQYMPGKPMSSLQCSTD
ncbi:hypothetical protein FKM82_031373 [Ascaphus truei]